MSHRMKVLRSAAPDASRPPTVAAVMLSSFWDRALASRPVRPSLGGFLSDLESGHDLQRLDHAGMVPLGTAMRRAAVEQLLRGRRVGERQPDRPRGRERKVEILLVQLDAEAGIEGA